MAKGLFDWQPEFKNRIPKARIIQAARTSRAGDENLATGFIFMDAI